jgi:hypothetical protein
MTSESYANLLVILYIAGWFIGLVIINNQKKTISVNKVAATLFFVLGIAVASKRLWQYIRGKTI